MPNSTAQNENQVRIYRENPIAWFDKETMRFLRNKFGKDKKRFLMIRSVYTAICEIESDFKDKPIKFFTKTVGTYAGVSREVAGKNINILQDIGLIKKTRLKDSTTKKFTSGTILQILSAKNAEEPKSVAEPLLKEKLNVAKKPLSGYPGNGSKEAIVGIPQRWDTQASIKNINTSKKLNINVNENLKIPESRKRNGMMSLSNIITHYDIDKHSLVKNIPKKKKPDEILKRDFLAQEMADTLCDQKSLGAFRTIAERVPESIIREYLANIKETSREGKVKKSRGALFVHMILQYTEKKQIDLGFNTRATP